MIEPTQAKQPAPAASATGPDEGQAPGLCRSSIEFLVVLCLSVLIFRTFSAEAYIVPTGSMAPTLLGMHREIDCPNCGRRVVLGLDDEGRSGRPVCSNCGQTDLPTAAAVDNNGDRVLVQKFVYDFRPPRRWEVAVFHFPGDPSQAYVKRVVALPGESVRIARGDVWINGRIARKSLAEQRAMRVPVYDNDFVPSDSARVPRWTFRRGRPDQGLATTWRAEGSRLVHTGGESGDRYDWAEYRNWDADRGRYAAIHDFNAYNGADVPGDNAVNDVMLEVRVHPGGNLTSLALRLDAGIDRFLVELPVAEAGPTRVWRNGRPVRLSAARPIALAPGTRQGYLLEASVMDQRLTVAVDGVLLFEPFDFDDPAEGPDAGASPVAIGVKQGSVRLSGLRVYRDIYYTSSLAFTPRKPFGIDEPYHLGPDDYFVLGDNSPVSNDSRFWPESPVVPREMLLGKPFLVHLPGQAVPLRVFGRPLYWVPDPREIRYIR